MKKFSKYIDRVELADPISALKQLVKGVIVCVPVLVLELGRKMPLLPKTEQLSFIKLALISNGIIFAVKILLTQNYMEFITFAVSSVLLGVMYFFKYRDTDRDGDYSDYDEEEEEDYDYDNDNQS